MKKNLLTAFCICFFTITGYSEDLKVPLVTLDASNMIKKDFEMAMSELSEYADNDFGSIVLGSGLLFGLPQWSGNLSGLYIKNITRWFSLPLFAGAAGNLIGDNGENELTLFGGGGIIIKNRFFYLGLIGGARGFFTSAYEKERGENNYAKFEYGIYPILNTEEYPILSYFLKEITAFLIPNESDSRVGKFDVLNYGLQFVFKGLFRLPVFDLYTISGHNNFMPEFDFSTSNMYIEPTDFFEHNIGGNAFRYGTGYFGTSESKIHKTFIYGLRVGSNRFVVDLNYLIIDELNALEQINSYIGVGRNDIERIYGDYDYPYGLNGFPSVTFNYTDDDARFYVRFSTLNNTGIPFVPDIGVAFKNIGFILYTPPINLSFALRFPLPFSRMF